MSEYVIAEKQDLINIADAIREKSGANGELAFPEAMIEAITGGSGTPKVATGTITFAEDTVLTAQNSTPRLLEHNAGFVPRIFVFFSTQSYIDTYKSANKSAFMGEMVVLNNQFALSKHCGVILGTSVAYGSGSFEGYTAGNAYWTKGAPMLDVNDKTVPVLGYRYNAKFLAGVVYQWYAISDWEGIL